MHSLLTESKYKYYRMHQIEQAEGRKNNIEPIPDYPMKRIYIFV